MLPRLAVIHVEHDAASVRVTMQRTLYEPAFRKANQNLFRHFNVLLYFHIIVEFYELLESDVFFS
jgi:hypothetical protein